METREYLKLKLIELKESSQKAIDEIIAEIAEPIDREISQEKRRAITKGKREAVEDVQSIMIAIQDLDERINETSSDAIISKKRDFKGGQVESRAK